MIPLRSSFRRWGWACVVFGSIASTQARGQGCSQCAQAIGQTPPETRRAYRRAISVLVISGAAVFGAGAVALKRFR